MNVKFFLRQVTEKCLKQNMPLYAVFIDFSKAIDTVPRGRLCQVFRKSGSSEKFIKLTASLHNGRKAYICIIPKYSIKKLLSQLVLNRVLSGP